MSRFKISCAGVLLLAISLQFPTRSLVCAETTTLVSATNKPAVVRLQPGPDDGRIAFLIGKLLEQYHYSHHPFDDSISSRFLDRYMESLDPQHLHFLKSDLDRFERYRTLFDDLTVTRKGTGDTLPAYEIYNRFVERLQERVVYAEELLRQPDQFRFDTDERIAVDRREVPYPQDGQEARALWRQRLRFEYLQEKLGLDSKKATPAVTNAPGKVEPAKSIHEQIVDTLAHRYHRTLRMFADWDSQDVLGIYLTALAHVYDPHSDYFNKEQLDSFKISMNLQLFGIGAELRSEDGFCKITRLLSGGPAMKSKEINAGDHIVGVAQSNQPPVDVIDMSLNKVVQMIRGPKGTQVELTIAPAGSTSAERRVVKLLRDEIPLEDQAAKGKVIEMAGAGSQGGNLRLGVISLPSFYAPMMEKPAADLKKEALGKYTSVDVAKLLTKFKQENVSGVILDLRFNGGGSLEEAIRLTGLFIKDGPVVQVRDMDGSIAVEKDMDTGVVYDGPLMVLTSRFSASASEIVAGALQDYGRALIVGDSSTHGKGTVQTVTSLRPLMQLSESDPEEPGALKFTIRKFYRASGASTQLKGVMPDIVLPSRWNDYKDIGEQALENPLPWDVIPTARFDKLNLVQPYLTELLKRSTARVSTNQDFVYIREDIQEYRKQQADKTVSLNEQERLKEKVEAEARQKARDNELRARTDARETVYEITLKQADLPGLPPPVARTNSVALMNGGSDAGTNSAAAPTPVDGVADSGAELDGEEKPPAVDANLNEASRILVDYLLLLPRNGPLLATQHERKP